MAATGGPLRLAAKVLTTAVGIVDGRGLSSGSHLARAHRVVRTAGMAKAHHRFLAGRRSGRRCRPGQILRGKTPQKIEQSRVKNLGPLERHEMAGVRHFQEF